MTDTPRPKMVSDYPEDQPQRFTKPEKRMNWHEKGVPMHKRPIFWVFVAVVIAAIVAAMYFKGCGPFEEKTVAVNVPTTQAPAKAVGGEMPAPVSAKTEPPVVCPPCPETAEAPAAPAPKPVLPPKKAVAPKKAPPAKPGTQAVVQPYAFRPDLLHTFEVRKGQTNIGLLTLAHDGEYVVNLVHRNKPVKVSARKLLAFTLVGYESGRAIEGKPIGNFQIEICNLADHDRANGWFAVEGEPGEEYWLNLGITQATGGARIAFTKAHEDHVLTW